MKLVPKVLLLILSAAGVILVTSITIQNAFTNKNARALATSDILVTTGLLEQFVSAGAMEEFSSFVRLVGTSSGDRTGAIHTVALLDGSLRTKLSSGRGSDVVELPAATARRLEESDEPIVTFGRETGEVLWPTRVTASCLECHGDMKPGELGAVLYLRFPLDRLKAIFEECEAGRYAGNAGLSDAVSLTEQSARLAKDLEKKLK